MKLVLAAAIALLFFPVTATAQWHEAKSRHFIIYSDQKPDELKAYATRLERYDQAVRKARGMPDPELTDANRLTVYVLKSQQAVGDMAGSQGVAGFYMGRASGPLAFVHRGKPTPRNKWDLDAETVFFHEYMHHLMLTDFGSNALPLWMIEGYAEFFATAELLPDGAVRFGAVPAYRAGTLFDADAYNVNLSVEEMVGGKMRDYDQFEFLSLYGKGWLLTHYMTFEPARRGQITRYVDGIQRGEPPLQSARAAFGDLKKLERELQAYLIRKTVSTVTIPASDINVGPIAIRPLSEAEAAILPVVMRSHRGVTKSQAPLVARDARRVAERFSSNPAVQAALAEAELDSKNLPAAIAAADRAITADPRNAKALIYRGNAMMEQAKKDKTKADWKAIRSYFIRANRVDPQDAEPLMHYYETFKESGQPATTSAVEGLFYAHELVPQDSGLRMAIVRQLIIDGKVDSARKAFGPIAFNPHLGKDARKDVTLIQEALVAKDGKKALAEIERMEAEAKKKAED